MTPMERPLLILATLGLLGGCATTSPAAQAAPAAPALEPLYAADAARDALTIRVSSNGCTKKEDFVALVSPTKAGVTVSFRRERPDRCRALVMAGVALSYTYAELGLDGQAPFLLLNPFTPWRGPAPSAP